MTIPGPKRLSALLDAQTARCLCSVIELGSLTKTALRLDTTKSQVSRTLTNLERRLGTTLLHRSGRNVKLTQAGVIVHLACQNFLQTLDEADAQLSHLQSGLGQKIRIAAPISIGNLLLAPVISEFVNAHPTIFFEAYWQNQTIDLLADGFDLAFQFGPLPDSRMVARRITSFEYHCCAAPSYLKKKGSPAAPADLAHHDRIAFPQKSYDPAWRFTSGNSSQVVTGEARLVVNSYPLAVQLCLDGLGVTRVPSYFCDAEIKQQKLVRLLENYQQPKQELFVLMSPKPRISEISRAFVDLCIRRLPF